MKVLVTGATGFIGKRFVEYSRSNFQIISLSLRNKSIAELNLNNADVIVHLAGKAHEMGPIDDKTYFDINYTLTRQLAEKAVEQKVSQFIYMSSTKVYGDNVKEILNEQSPCNPEDAYGKSKLEAEKFLIIQCCSYRNSSYNLNRNTGFPLP
jgi:UDP-glucose 4-epimerase